MGKQRLPVGGGGLADSEKDLPDLLVSLGVHGGFRVIARCGIRALARVVRILTQMSAGFGGVFTREPGAGIVVLS
jgi:hypothetical protein